MAMDKGSGQLFVIMKDIEFQYCLYRFSESRVAPKNSEEESTICQLENPLLTMDKPTYPHGMSFVAVGTSIYMVGGGDACNDDNQYRASDKTFIYDTLSDKCVPGPKMISGKNQPFLLTVGSKIFALSRFIHSDDPNNSAMDPKPWFEVLDTEVLERGWSELPLPEFCISQEDPSYMVEACAAVDIGGGSSCVIFVSVEDAGTYAFDVDKNEWQFINHKSLPFCGLAIQMPPSTNFPYANTLWCAASRHEGLSAFRFRYENNDVLQVDVIEIGHSPVLSPLLAPDIYLKWSLTAIDLFGRVYFVVGGIDDPEAFNSFHGNRYVKVCALEVCKVKLNEGQLLKSCKKKNKKKREMEYEEEENETFKLDSNKGQLLKKCNKRKEMENDEEEDETLTRDSNKEVLKKCKKGKEMGHDEEQSETVTLDINQEKSLKRCRNEKRHIRIDKDEDEIIELKMIPTWRRSFFGGLMCAQFDHVTAAFAM